MASIVVIEDEWSIREMVKDLLQSEGHEVRTARNGHEGVEVVLDCQPDLVISDIRMPGIDGFEVLDAIRSNPDTEAALFIFLTAQGERPSHRRGMELGADDYITKPFRVEELIAAVNAQLEKRTILSRQTENTLNTLRQNIVYALPHELRTPLSIIMGNADILAEDLYNLPPDDILNMVRTIRKHSLRLHDLFENYLIYAQIELTASDPAKRNALRNHIIRDAGAVIGTAAETVAAIHQRQADLNLVTSRLALQISESNLQKIVAELVDNAFKFSEPGTNVVVEAARNGSVFQLSVQDRGRGLTSSQVEQIGAYMQFERNVFEQQGLGLGLIIARRLIELHDGTLTIKSNPGQGTCVCLEMPLYG